mmetsp:Transcript_11374/g.23323  ORF Transcript_11374/g.23323 Transcript_11374/m.23323 type:complete len:925 (-) Transcript_11374:431-3205(-)
MSNSSAIDELRNFTLAPSSAPSVFPSLGTVVATEAPTAIPSNFTCVDSTNPTFPNICYPKDLTAGYGVAPIFTDYLQYLEAETNGNGGPQFFLPIFGCRTKVLTDDRPNTVDCDSLCVLQYSAFDTVQFCTACALVGTELVYDCRNLLESFSNLDDEERAMGQITNKVVDTTNDQAVACAARDYRGVCGDYNHWYCVPWELGVACEFSNRPWVKQDPVFPFDNVSEISQLTVYCLEDITGLDLSFCQRPRCILISTNPARACASCRVLSGGKDDDDVVVGEPNRNQTNESPYDFAYTCEDFPSLSCPILDDTGACSQGIVYENETNYNIAGIPSLQKTAEESSGGWTWTITRISPTAFNVLSDIFGYITRVLFGVAFATIYPLLLTWQVRYLKKPVPVNALGSEPGDVFQSASLIRLFAWSLPAIIMSLLLLIADFSHSLANAGFDAVGNPVAGSTEPVFLISNTTQGRNFARSISTSGDPKIARTTAVNAIFAEEGKVNESREQTALRNNFFSATTFIARGSSPFVEEAIRPWRESLRFGGVFFNTWWMPDDSPIAAMNREIPMTCASLDLAEIEEVMFGFSTYDNPIHHTALLPNCTFNGPRSSGIFQDVEMVEIVEYARFVGITPALDGPDTGEEILLQRANESFQIFSLSHSQKKLARDRVDWKQGRIVEDAFDTLEIGNVTIGLGRIVLATGSDAAEGDTEYTFVGQVQGACPDRPSGLSNKSTQCIVFIQATCETFEEDFASRYDKVYAPMSTDSSCELSDVSVVWGRNFAADSNLVSVVAALYGMIRPDSTQDIQVFFRNSILSALFLLATLDERPSIEIEVQAEVNIVYVFFILLPVVLSLLMIFVARQTKDKLIPIPQSAWDMMVLGQEDPTIPKRPTRASPFPEMPQDFVLTFFDASEVELDTAGSGIMRTSQP